jgi:hypothetical protein
MAAPSAVVIFGCLGEHLAEGTIDLDTDTIKVALVTSAYAPNTSTHDRRSNFSANELATGSGYTSGGSALSGVAVTRAALVTTMDADDLSFAASGGTIGPFRYAVLYANVTRNGITDPLIGYVTLDSAPADVSIASGNTLTIQWATAGILTVSA